MAGRVGGRAEEVGGDRCGSWSAAEQRGGHSAGGLRCLPGTRRRHNRTGRATAIDCGYRSIDTAALYGNEAGVGRAVATCGVPREELFVATKLWNDDQGYDSTFRAFEASLQRLGMSYVDLYLIHWPKPSLNKYVESWRALEHLHADGRARAIGVSNFQVAHLQRLLDETQVVPAVNQIELDPQLQQDALRHFHTAHGIATRRGASSGRGTRWTVRSSRSWQACTTGPRPGHAPLASATGQRGDPEVDHSVADPGEHRAVRF